ncbi:MAG: hypothetical protein H3C49_09090 [Alphaproteobacteria bacterium]|nr:hypothetical protein [Alphaproteobacteria bacterium]
MADNKNTDDKNTEKNGKPKKDADPLAMLEKERNRLQERYDTLTGKARGEVGDVGFWGAVGALALMADWTFTGGLGTAFAAWSAGEYVMYARRAREVGKELKVVKSRIQNMQQARFEAQIQQMKQAPQKTQGAVPDTSLKDEFSPAAQAEIESLRSKLATLEKQVGQMQEDKAGGLDKPKFKKPFGKKPDEPKS